MHYLKLVKEGTIEDFIQSDDAKFPCVCCYSESHPNYSTQQDAIITKSKPIPSLFPLSFNLSKFAAHEYKCDATAESIWLADYILENAVYDNAASYDVQFEPGQLYIDGIEITSMGFSTINSKITSNYCWWTGCDSKYNGSSVCIAFYLYDNEEYPKGTFYVDTDD